MKVISPACSGFVGESSMLPAYIPIEVDANPEICDAITSRGKQAWILYRMKINPFYLERKTWKDRFRYWLRMTLVKWGLI